MRKTLVLTALTAAVVLQGCQTTKTGICKICHPEEAVRAEAAAAPRQSPLKKADAWMQEHMW